MRFLEIRCLKTDRFFRIEVQSTPQAAPLLVIQAKVIALLTLQKLPNRNFFIDQYSTGSPSHQRRLKRSNAFTEDFYHPYFAHLPIGGIWPFN